MAPETLAGALVPGAGVFAYAGHCAALSDALRAYENVSRRNGREPLPLVVAYRIQYERMATEYERYRSAPISPHTSAVAKAISASPHSEWVDVRHAALALGLTERQIRNLCYKGVLRSAQDNCGRHELRIDPQSVENERARRGYEQVEDHGSTDS